MVALLALLRRCGSLLVLSVGAGYVAFTAAATPAGVRLGSISFTCAFPWLFRRLLVGSGRWFGRCFARAIFAGRVRGCKALTVDTHTKFPPAHTKPEHTHAGHTGN